MTYAQSQNVPAKTKPAPGKPEPPGKVEVQPPAADDEIRNRLLGILRATGCSAPVVFGLSEKHYDKQLQAGRILITVRPEGRFNEALAILKRHEAPSELHTITDQAPSRA